MTELVENLDELFSRHPDTWQQPDLEKMVNYFRASRIKWQAAEATKAPRAKKVTSDKLAGLNLEGIEL